MGAILCKQKPFYATWFKTFSIRQTIFNYNMNSGFIALTLTSISPSMRLKPEDHWSCIAHLSAEDMLKSAVIEEKKFKRSSWAAADNLLGPKF